MPIGRTNEFAASRPSWRHRVRGPPARRVVNGGVGWFRRCCDTDTARQLQCTNTAVAALLDQWFARGRPTWSPTTIRSLTSMVERHLEPGLGDILVGDLTTAIADKYSAELGDTPTLRERAYTGVRHSRPYHQARHDCDGERQSEIEERYRPAGRLNRCLCRCCSFRGLAPVWDVCDLNVAKL
jgi:Phage integrase, N-terminal SAM-like domain